MSNRSKITALVIIVAIPLLFMLHNPAHAIEKEGVLPSVSTTNPTPLQNLTGDPFLITVDIFGNQSDPATGFGGGTTNYFSNETVALPQKLIVIARSPGVSFLTVMLNGSYQIQNLRFTSGQVNYSFQTSFTGKSYMQIYVVSQTYNLSKGFRYGVNIMTVSKYINYENEVHKIQKPSIWNSFTVFEVVMAGITGAIVGPELYDYQRWEKARHPTFDRYIIGGIR